MRPGAPAACPLHDWKPQCEQAEQGSWGGRAPLPWRCCCLLPAAARAATREQRQAETFGGGKVTADAGTKVKTSKSGDMWSVDVNEHEHYQISEAVISGG